MYTALLIVCRQDFRMMKKIHRHAILQGKNPTLWGKVFFPSKTLSILFLCNMVLLL